MDPRIEERVETWEPRSVAAGYRGLDELSSSDFTGAVRARGTWAFLLNGRIVGVVDGSLEGFEGSDLRAFDAPHRSLPLLFTMWERGGETRAKYYTEDTSISEVDRTLSSGNFTGYVELSENVLSGDYYLVYYGGRSMSVAFVGNSEQLVTGDEAFERADDEVGIYEVVEVDVEVRDVPEPTDAGGSATDPNAGEPTGESAGSDAGPAGSIGGPGESGPIDAGAPEPTDVGASEPTDPEPAGNVDAGGSAGEDPSLGDDPEWAEGGPGDPTATSEATADGSIDDPGERSTDEGAGGSTATDDEVRTATERSVPPDETLQDPSGGGPSGDPDQSTGEAAPTEGPDARRERGGRDEQTDPGGHASETPDRADSSRADASRAEPTSGHEEDASPPDASADAEPNAAAGRQDAGTDSAEGRTRDASAAGTVDHSTAEERGNATTPDETGPTGDGRTEAGQSEGGGSTPSPDAGAPGDGQFDAEQEWQESKTIPALDPDRTATPDGDDSPDAQSGSAAAVQSTRSETAERTRDRQGQPSASSESAGGQSTATESASAQSSATDEPSTTDASQTAGTGAGGEAVESLRRRVATLQSERDELESERDELARKVEELEEENEALRSELRRLDSEVDRLEQQLSEARSAADAPAAGQSLSRLEALAATDLLVRYDSKADPTLEAVIDGDADPSAVNQNLRLDYHTRFDADDVTVGGTAFDEFLRDTVEYRFVEWLVRTLPYEIRDAGGREALRDLYEAFPDFDRIQLRGDVTIEYVEDGETVREEATFDVVVRDGLGEPRVVANLNDSRDPATGDMAVDLQQSATRVKETTDGLNAAFLVTRSFFEPEALETVTEATGGSFLSRDSRRSFVKLTRKRGYHLCLVEDRSDDLFLKVPEL